MRIPAHLAMVVITATVAACATAPARPAAVAQTAPSPRPNTDAVLRLVGRFGAAHACPISDRLALTSAHVAQTDAWQAYPLKFSDGAGHEGELSLRAAEWSRDLALMESSVPLERWYPIAAEAPKVGERLYALGFDMRRRRDALGPRLFELSLLRVVARNLVAEPTITQGTSGSCVLNSAGAVVAVISWSLPTEDLDSAAVAVGVYGEKWPRE